MSVLNILDITLLIPVQQIHLVFITRYAIIDSDWSNEAFSVAYIFFQSIKLKGVIHFC